MMQVYPVKFIATTFLMSLALAQDKVNPDAQLVQDFEKRVNDYPHSAEEYCEGVSSDESDF